MKYILCLFLLVPVLSNAKVLTYGYIGGKWLCHEQVGGGRQQVFDVIKECSSNNMFYILKRDDINFVKDGNFHVALFDENKRRKPLKYPCGLQYNPKDGKTYKYQECVYSYKY